MTTYDCAATLTDSQVAEFCMHGYIMLESVVPSEVNRRVVGWLDAHRTGSSLQEMNQLVEEP
jgi:hypothetical protein